MNPLDNDHGYLLWIAKLDPLDGRLIELLMLYREAWSAQLEWDSVSECDETAICHLINAGLIETSDLLIFTDQRTGEILQFKFNRTGCYFSLGEEQHLLNELQFPPDWIETKNGISRRKRHMSMVLQRERLRLTIDGVRVQQQIASGDFHAAFHRINDCCPPVRISRIKRTVESVKSEPPAGHSQGTLDASRIRYSPWITSSDKNFLQLLRDNKRGLSEKTITRVKKDWGAESQQGSNNQIFRFPLDSLRSNGISYPADWDQTVD